MGRWWRNQRSSRVEPEFRAVNNERSVLAVNCYQISFVRCWLFYGFFLYFALHILPFNFQSRPFSDSSQPTQSALCLLICQSKLARVPMVKVSPRCFFFVQWNIIDGESLSAKSFSCVAKLDIWCWFEGKEVSQSVHELCGSLWAQSSYVSCC